MKKKLLFVCLLALLMGVVGCTEQDKQDLQDLKNELSLAGDRSAEGLRESVYRDVYKDAKDIIAQADILDCPSTAVYPAYSSNFVTKNEDGSYTVSAYLDAQNVFGAMVRIDYEMLLIYESDNTITYYIY